MTVLTAAATGSAWPARGLTTVIIVAAIALAIALGVYAVRDRSVPKWALLAIAGLEVLLLVMTFVAGIAWSRGELPAEPVVFLFYLLAVLAIPPAMAWWGRGEPGRWGSGVVAVACLVLVVLVLRVVQVWAGTPGAAS